jgi:predicted dehydrogenase
MVGTVMADLKLGLSPSDVIESREQILQPSAASDVVEVVTNSYHRHVWAVALAGEGARVLIRMNERTWRNPKSSEPTYDVFLGRDPQGYQTFFNLKHNADGTVNGVETAKALSIKKSRCEETPWLKEALQTWMKSLDGTVFDSTYRPQGARAVNSDQRILEHGYARYDPGVTGSKDGLRVFPAPIQPEPNLDPASIGLSERSVVFYGGLGAVVNRFYKKHLTELKDRFRLKFVCVDLADREAGWRKIDAQELPFDEYVPASDFRFDPKKTPAGLVILTRPDTHFALADLANAREVQSFIEKPVVHPRHLEEFLTLYERRQAEMLAIDFFFDNPLVQRAMELIGQGKLGELSALNGSMLEDVRVENGREWLVNSKISGGGLGMDMMVHLTALAEMVLERWGKTLANATIDPEKLVMAKYRGSPEGAETYARLSGAIPGPISFSFEAGKGLHTSQYFLIAEGSKGSLEINLGTENTPGFMRYAPNEKGQEEIYFENPTDDIGYAGTVKKTLASCVDPASVSAEERRFRVDATTLSVRLLDTAAYMFGTNYYEVELGQNPQTIQVLPDRALSPSDRTKDNFRIIDSFAEKISEVLPSVLLSSTDGAVTLDPYFMLWVGDRNIGFIVMEPRTRELVVQFDEDCDLSEGDRASILACYRELAQADGWSLVAPS